MIYFSSPPEHVAPACLAAAQCHMCRRLPRPGEDYLPIHQAIRSQTKNNTCRTTPQLDVVWTVEKEGLSVMETTGTATTCMFLSMYRNVVMPIVKEE